MLNGMKVKTVCAALLAIGMGIVCVPVSLADGYYRVYGEQPYTPRLTPTIKPISQPAYNPQPANYNYSQSNNYDEQPALYGYDSRVTYKKSISDKIEDGFRDLWHSPNIRKGIVGAGAGLGLAALAERNLAKGSLVGAGVGLGVSAMDDSYYFSRHPLVRRTGKGALIGLGVAAVTSAAALLPAAAVGAGIGAGMHYINSNNRQQ